MCWTCENPRADYLGEVVLPTIARYGWMVQGVRRDRLHPPLAYTVGLTDLGRAELVVTGRRLEPAAVLLSQLAAHLLHAPELAPGDRLDLAEQEIELVELPRPDAHLHIAAELYGERLAARQLVWADERGRWPWETGHRGGRGGQPVLGPRAPGRVAGAG